jgi:hypothetical protein
MINGEKDNICYQWTHLPLWSKRLTIGGKMKYYAEVPAEHGKTTITALTVE